MSIFTGYTKPDSSVPELPITFACSAPLTNTTPVTIQALVTGKTPYITSFQYQNTNATATELQIKANGTVIWRGYAPASMTAPAQVAFLTPLKGTLSQAITLTAVTTAANVYHNMQGFLL